MYALHTRRPDCIGFQTIKQHRTMVDASLWEVTSAQRKTCKEYSCESPVARPPAGREPRIDFAGVASFALFFSAKGAGLDAALPKPFAGHSVEPEIVFEVPTLCVEYPGLPPTEE